MKENRFAPPIRFKEFIDDWKQKKFSEEVILCRGLTYSPNDIRTNGIRVLRSSNVNEGRFTTNEDDVFVDENAINIDYAQNGDILITGANGSTELVGKHAIIRDLPNNSAVHGGFMLLGRTPYPNFINASMSSPWYKNFIYTHVTGGNGAIGNLKKSELDDCLFMVPSISEQIKIGNFFEKLDSLVAIHQYKYETLKKYKEGLIGALYITCPTRESYPLKYFLNEYSEKNQNNYKAVAVGKNGIRSREEIFSKEIAKDVSKNKVISKNTLIIGMGTKEIDIGILTDDIRLSVSPAYRTFNIKNIDAIYLEQILASENKLLSTRFMIQSARQGKTVDVQGFLNHKIYIHNQKAQKDISKLTMILNDLISVTNKKLDACTKVKRFLLDNMFI